MTITVNPEDLKRDVETQPISLENADAKKRGFFLRTPLRNLSFPRLLRGGRLNDFGRVPRYLVISSLVLSAIWVPISSYVILTPESFTSNLSLILPGTGVSSSINLSDIGQATTSSNSAYSSSSISPTVTYQKLFQSGRVITRAATELGITESQFGRPRVRLVDQTSFMQIEMNGASPNEARERAEQLLNAFRVELEDLRNDEIRRREESITGTVAKYQDAVNEIRDRISQLQLNTGLRSSDQFGNIVDANESLRMQITLKEAEFEEAREAVSSLQGLLGLSPQTASATMKLHSDPEYTALSSALSEAAAKQASLAQRFGSRHPQMVVARKNYLGIRIKMLDRAMRVTGLSVEELETELERAAGGERGQMMASLMEKVAKRNGLEAQTKALTVSYNSNYDRSAELIQTASELEKLNRDYKVAEAVFTSALARISVSKTDIFASYPMVQVAEAPSLPWKASSPNIIVAIAAGIAASIFALIGLGLGWVRRPLINKVMSAIVGKRTEPDATA